MSRKRHIVLGACCTTHGIADGLSSSIYVLLPLVAQTFSLGFAQVGLIRATFGGAMAMLEFPSGVIAERTGERPLMVFGLACAGIGYLSLSVAGGFGAVLACLFVTGVGAAFQHSLCSALITRSFDDASRRTALGTYNSAGEIGKLAATGALSALLGAGVAWHQAVALYGAVALVAAGVLLVALRRVAAGSRVTGGGAGDGRARGDWGIRHRGGFAALAAMVLIDIAVQDAFLTFVAFLMLAKGLSTGLAALAVLLVLTGGIVGKFGCGLLAQRVGVIRSLVTVELLTATGIVAVCLVPPMVAFVLLPLVGMVLQGSSSITYGTVGDLVRANRQSRGFAMIYTMSSIASLAGPLTLGLAADRLGIATAMLWLAVVILIVPALCVALRAALAPVAAAQA